MPPFHPCGIVAFLSDFGTSDAYVAEVKGAMLCRFAGVRIVDVTHEVPPGDLVAGAFRLARAASAFPPGTTFLAVVDPGVGTSRRPVVVSAGGMAIVGPDNGLLSWAVDGLSGNDPADWRQLSNPSPPRGPMSLTFHGRDLFGPAAASLAGALLTPEACGPRVDDPVVLSFPRGAPVPGGATASIVAVDRFGNLVVALAARHLPAARAHGDVLGVVCGTRSFDAVFGPYGAGGPLVVHEDSSGFVEVAVPGGSAADLLGAQPGDEVRFEWDARDGS